MQHPPLRSELKILLLADAMLLLAMEMFGPLYAIFVAEIGGDLLTAGWAYATFSMTSGVVILILSRLSLDIRGRDWVVPVGYGLCSLGILGYLFVSAPIHLFVVQVVMGLALAVLTPSWDALYTHFIDPERAVYQWGLEEAQDYIVPAIAAAIGGVIAQYFGFRVLFILMFLASLAGVFISLRVIGTTTKNAGAND